MPTPHRPSIAATRAIRKIGKDIKEARLRRRLPMEVVADRAFISRNTLAQVEKGESAVSIGIYASVLHALGLLGRFADVAEDDHVGRALESEQLPKRIRTKRRKDDDVGGA
jgi:transcriptional regulator with XRE-family HTH domain